MKKETYSPAWAPHVVAEIGEVEEFDGGAPGQRVECACSKCGAKWKSICMRGQPRATALTFAREHAHSTW